jgi:hypothetical protein
VPPYGTRFFFSDLGVCSGNGGTHLDALDAAPAREGREFITPETLLLRRRALVSGV